MYANINTECETDDTLECKLNIPLPHASRTTLYNMTYYAQKIKTLIKNAEFQNSWKTLSPRQNNSYVVSEINTGGCKYGEEAPAV